MTVINSKTLDEIATLEADAILEGLKDPKQRQNPAFLEKVRKFLVQNNLKTTPETPAINQIQKVVTEIPTFEPDFDGDKVAN